MVINVCSHPVGRLKAMQLSLAPAQLRTMLLSTMARALLPASSNTELHSWKEWGGQRSHFWGCSSQPVSTRLPLAPPVPPILPPSWWARVLTGVSYCMLPCTSKCPKWWTKISSCSHSNLFMSSKIKEHPETVKVLFLTLRRLALGKPQRGNLPCCTWTRSSWHWCQPLGWPL